MNYLFGFLGQTHPKVSEATLGQTRPQAARAAVGLAPPKGAHKFFLHCYFRFLFLFGRLWFVSLLFRLGF
jgi:hypothetical protein